jgi:hypothetical protein
MSRQSEYCQKIHALFQGNENTLDEKRKIFRALLNNIRKAASDVVLEASLLTYCYSRIELMRLKNRLGIEN